MLSVSIASCGGGGGSSKSSTELTDQCVQDETNPGTGPGNRAEALECIEESRTTVFLSEEEFLFFDGSGSWKMTIDLDTLRTDGDSEAEQTETQITSLSQTPITLTPLINDEVANGVIIGGCLAGSDSILLDATDTALALSGIADNIENRCGVTPRAVYTYNAPTFEVTDSYYEVEYSCRGDVVGTVVFDFVGRSDSFNYGELNYTSNDHGSYELNTGVCGILANADTSITTTTTTTLDSSQEYSMVFSGPDNNGDMVSFYFTFNQAISEGSYTIIPIGDDLDTRSTSGNVSGASISGSAALPGSIEITSGSLEITGVSSSSASGSFDFFTADGDNFVGKFNFAL